jgi:tetratricopeptide (TPR) repeat protein
MTIENARALARRQGGSGIMRGFVFFAVACLVLTGPLRAQNSSGAAGHPKSKATFLKPGKPLERALQGGEKHIYAIRAETGHFIHAIVDQLGIDVALTLYAPDDKPIGSMDSPNGAFGLEQISTIAEAPGIYRLEVASGDKNVPAGRYRVTVEPVRAPSGQDRARMAAEQMLFEAAQLQVQGSADSSKTAIQKYLASLPLWRTAGDRYEEALTLDSVGLVYSSLGEKQKALDYYNQSLVLWRAVGDRADEATTLNNIGLVYDDLGEKQKALEYYNQALPLTHAAGDRAGEAITLANIGWAYSALGEKQKALEYYNQALPLMRPVGDRASEAAALGNIGLVYSALGEKQKALEYYNQALPLRRAVGDRAGEAKTLTHIGEVYDDLGEKQKALDYYNQSLPLSRAVQYPLGEASTLVRMMEYWKSLRNPSLAVLFGKQAIDRFQQVRRNIGGLEKEVQQSFLKSKEDYYRELAELLVSGGRLPEAQQVLDMLKAEEYSDFTQRRGDTGSGTNPVARTPAEEKSNQEYERITGEITATGAEWTELHAKSSRSAEEENRYNELSDQLTAANQRFQVFLKTLYDSFGKGDQANAKVETINEQTAGLQTLVGELGAGTAAVYTLVLEEKCVVMVITPATRVAREIPIGKIALRGKVFAFARALASHQFCWTIPSRKRAWRRRSISTLRWFTSRATTCSTWATTRNPICCWGARVRVARDST